MSLLVDRKITRVVESSISRLEEMSRIRVARDLTSPERVVYLFDMHSSPTFIAGLGFWRGFFYPAERRAS
jgi:hypothetical protein